MSQKTGIEWTDATWNPIAGCSLVSPGCTNCYAMKKAHELVTRFDQAKYRGLTKLVNGKPVWTGKMWIGGLEHMLPLKWRAPKRIFVNSMSDLFHEGVPDEAIDAIFAVMALCPQHTFQVLTKRPEHMRDYCKTLGRHHEIDRVSLVAKQMSAVKGFTYDLTPGGWALPNVWLGVSVEDQRRADERIPILLDTPAAVRWISAEPLLGPVDLEKPMPGPDMDQGGGAKICRPWYIQSGLDWVVVGGESGPGAQPMHPDWARRLRDQCAAAGVAFLFKQWGEFLPCTWDDHDGTEWSYAIDKGCSPHPHGDVGRGGRVEAHDREFLRLSKKRAGRTLDGRTHDEYPQVRA
jgi:protein gp37